jgi:hypothetical protein
MATTDYSLKARSEILDYEKKYKVKKNIGTKNKPNWVDWDNKRKQAWNQKIVTDAKKQLLFGSKTPLADKQYEAGQFRIKQLEHDTYNTLASKIRRRFSPKTDVEGERVIDLTRALRIQNAKTEADKLKIGTKYARIEDKESLKELGNLTEGKEQNVVVTAKENPTPENQVIANDVFKANNGEALPFPTNYEGTWVDGKFIPSGTNFSQTPSKGDAEFQPDVESPTGGKAQESLKIDSKLERAYDIVNKHASGKNSVRLQRAKLYIRQHGG